LAASPPADTGRDSNSLTSAERGTRQLPSAAVVLRRGLILWGAGHISIGDRRGWLLLISQPLAVAALLLIGVQLIDGTRWLVVFPPLAALLIVWLAQAIHAYRRAVDLGATPTGELQAALFLPFAVTVLTLFWLMGGRHGSPAATLEGYVVAWMGGRPDAASALYETPPAWADLSQSWSVQSAYLTNRVTLLATQFGDSSGLDPTQPFDNLRFGDPVAIGPGRQSVEIDIVRRQRVETMILGIVPTAGQETVTVERAGAITLAMVDEPPAAWLPFGRLASSAWRIEGVTIGAP
jgi:hypothetical protein